MKHTKDEESLHLRKESDITATAIGGFKALKMKKGTILLRREQEFLYMKPPKSRLWNDCDKNGKHKNI